ncbi:MAG TPA: DUF1648 domain-containing protein [Azonexus sp.]|nr:DUF1648 domain-containing protein [Azonexus sp.]
MGGKTEGSEDGFLRRWLLAVLLGLGGVIWLTGRSLPDVVASHFSAGGGADGWMPRGAYLALMFALTVGLPAIVAYMPLLRANGSARGLNIPNRDYWLDPARRHETIRLLNGFMARFALCLALLLTYAHTLAVRANALVPPHFPEHEMIGALVLFVLAVLFLSWRLLRRFRQLPERR